MFQLHITYSDVSMDGKDLKGTGCETSECILPAFRKNKTKKTGGTSSIARKNVIYIYIYIYTLRDYVPNEGLNYRETRLPDAEYLWNSSKMYGLYDRKNRLV
jgi:hypothetical protein